jgi:4-hydroxy-2-oxoheptanedioate aldolase
MIEDTEAVANLDEILTVPGVDVFLVAANDLGQSMGNAGPEAVADVMRQVVPKIRAAGKNVGVCGNSSADAALVAEFINLGANFVTVTAWGLFRLGGQDFLRLVEEQVEAAAARA